MFRRIFVVFVLLCWSGPVFAAHPLITDDTGTVGKGIEISALNRR